MNIVSYISFLIVGLVLFSCDFGFGDKIEPQDVYVKYYGDVGDHRVADLLLNSRGEVILFGTQLLTSSDAIRNLYLVKADSLGNQLGNGVVLNLGDQKLMDTTILHTARTIKEIPGGYVILGNGNFINGTEQSDQFIFWILLDYDFQLISSTSYDTISSLGLGDRVNMVANDVIVSSDGNLIIAGSTEYPQENDQYVGGLSQNLLIKSTFLGDSIYWRRSDGRPSFTDEIKKIYELPSGDIAAVGVTNRIGSDGEGGQNVSYLIYNNEGLSQVGLTTRVGLDINGNFAADDVPNDIIGFDGGVRVVGTTSLGNVSRVFVMNFQGTSVTKNIVEPGDPAFSTEGVTITQARSGDLVLAGKNSTVQNGDIYIVRASQTGDIRADQEKTFGIASGSDVAKASVTLPTGSLLIAADMDFGSGQVMMSLMKINDRIELQKQ